MNYRSVFTYSPIYVLRWKLEHLQQGLIQYLVDQHLMYFFPLLWTHLLITKLDIVIHWILCIICFNYVSTAAIMAIRRQVPKSSKRHQCHRQLLNFYCHIKIFHMQLFLNKLLLRQIQHVALCMDNGIILNIHQHRHSQPYRVELNVLLS